MICSRSKFTRSKHSTHGSAHGGAAAVAINNSNRLPLINICPVVKGERRRLIRVFLICSKVSDVISGNATRRKSPDGLRVPLRRRSCRRTTRVLYYTSSKPRNHLVRMEYVTTAPANSLFSIVSSLFPDNNKTISVTFVTRLRFITLNVLTACRQNIGLYGFFVFLITIRIITEETNVI